MTSNPNARIMNWQQAKRRGHVERLAWTAGTYLLLTVLSLPIVVLFLWLAVTAFAPVSASADTIRQALMLAVVLALTAGPIALWAMRAFGKRIAGVLAAVLVFGLFALAIGLFAPVDFTIANFAPLWDRTALMQARGIAYDAELFPSLWQAAGNSATIAAASSIVSTLIATATGYFISRHDFVGRRHAFSLFLLLHAFPIVTLLVPVFLMMNFLGLVDSKAAVVLVICAFELPFGIFVMKGFFDSIPWSIEMSALADGASRTGAFFRILLPQATGGMLAIGFFGFLRGWEEYIFAQSLIYSRNNWTMSQFVFYAADDFAGTVNYGVVFAVGLLYLVPSVLVYLAANRHVENMSFGGVKA